VEGGAVHRPESAPPQPEPPQEPTALEQAIDALFLLADGASWGPANASRPASYFKGSSGAGWGPARRALDRLREGGVIVDIEDGSWTWGQGE
jgi:hypothetical protein